MYNFDEVFKRFTDNDPSVPVWCLTPNDGCYTHRFFDTIPISPSGRYLAVLNMPFENRPCAVGDKAEVVVVDLETGDEKTVYETYGWEHQLGANINWGETNEELIFNDVDQKTFDSFAVCLNFKTGDVRKLEHTIYHVSPDGKTGVSSNLQGTRKSQFGYGVVVPDEFVPMNTVNTDDDGVWLTDIKTGKTKLLLSIKEIFDKCYTELEKKFFRLGLVYVFHTKWSPDGKKIMFSIRHIRERVINEFNVMGLQKGLMFTVLTCNADGSDLEIAIDHTQWAKGGHHTTWSPTSDYLTMNLCIENTGQRLCRASLKGRIIEKYSEKVIGSGHPSINKHKMNIMMTDTYADEPPAFVDGVTETYASPRDGSALIRMIDLDKDSETTAVKINIVHEANGMANGVLRVDPHPVWDKTGRYAIFNGHTDGCRRVFIADMQTYLQD